MRRLFGYLDYTHTPLQAQTLKECPAFRFLRKARHGGIYVSTTQVSHFTVLKEQLRREMLRVNSGDAGRFEGGGLGYWTQMIS